MSKLLLGLWSVPFLVFTACGTSTAPSEGTATEATATTVIQPAAPRVAKVGAAAPDFSLDDLDGVPFALSEHRGKTVVLEWFNPDCPFVKLAHARPESLKTMGNRLAADGVVFVAINSGGKGRQGYGAEANTRARKTFVIDYPILLDPKGEVGKMYAAERTPHMYVIAPSGQLVYRGAIDNTRGGDLEDVDRPINYVAQALDEISAGKPVSVPETTAWGCTVKYAQ